MESEEYVDGLVLSFHDAVSVLCTALYADPSFNIKIYGYGFNGISLPIGLLTYGTPVTELMENLKEECDYFGFLSNYGCHIYHVLKDAVALGESSGSDGSKQNDKVLFTVKSDEKLETLQLSLSSRTFCKLNEMYQNIGLASAVKVSQSPDGAQLFHLQGDIAEKMLNSYVNNLAIVRPKGLFGIHVQPENNVKVKPFVVQHLGENIQGVKCKFAIHCPQWPGNVHEWLKRDKPYNWPDIETINSVVQNGVYLIPAVNQPIGDGSMGGELNLGHWQYSFAQAEKQLISSLPPNAKLFVKIVIGFIEPIEEMCCINNFELHHCFLHSLLWFFEKNLSSIDCCDNEHRIASLQKFMNFMRESMQSEKHFCNYFLPEVNLCPTTNFKKLVQVISSMSEDESVMKEILEETTVSSVIDFLNQTSGETDSKEVWQIIANKITDSLTTSFTGTVKMAYHCLFAKLHNSKDIQQCIELHQQMLLSFKSESCDTNIKDWCMRLLSNSLGNLYLARAQESQVAVKESRKSSLFSKSPKKVPTSETFYYLQKAEELLLTANNIDLIAGRVKLASFYYMNKKFQECCELVDEIFHVTGLIEGTVSAHDEIHPDAAGNSVISANYFLKPLVERNIVLELLFSDLDKITLPSFMSTNISFTRCSFLGDQKTAVYVIDADIYAHLLHAMCWHYLDDTDKAMILLEKLENLWNKAQFDLNEKRNVSYLNMIAACYLEVGERQKCEELLELSHKNLPNPIRNPAYFRLVNLRSEHSRKVAQRTVSFAVGIAVVATVVGVIKSKIL